MVTYNGAPSAAPLLDLRGISRRFGALRVSMSSACGSRVARHWA